MVYSGAGGKLIHEKNQKQKISWHCPFKTFVPITSKNSAPRLFLSYYPNHKLTESSNGFASENFATEMPLRFRLWVIIV